METSLQQKCYYPRRLVVEVILWDAKIMEECELRAAGG